MLNNRWIEKKHRDRKRKREKKKERKKRKRVFLMSARSVSKHAISQNIFFFFLESWKRWWQFIFPSKQVLSGVSSPLRRNGLEQSCSAHSVIISLKKFLFKQLCPECELVFKAVRCQWKSNLKVSTFSVKLLEQ